MDFDDLWCFSDAFFNFLQQATRRFALILGDFGLYLLRFGGFDSIRDSAPRYKSKYNKAFMWQSRRLFGRHHLRVFAKKAPLRVLSDGLGWQEVYGKTDFMDFLRCARGRNPVPEPKPEEGALRVKKIGGRRRRRKCRARRP